MMPIALQLSPEAQGAYFADALRVAEIELEQVYKHPVRLREHGGLRFFELECNAEQLTALLRLSFVQGAYAIEGELLRPLAHTPDFFLHPDFVFGSKFRGKTHERLTQLLINIGLSALPPPDPAAAPLRLLDPLCGRATTLLWAMRYGIQAFGVEQDPLAHDDVRRHLKKWAKLHRQKHQIREGFTGKANRKGRGRTLDFSTPETSMRMVIGDAREAHFKKEQFDLIVSDIPYGIQHGAGPQILDLLEECAVAWRPRLRGALVLAYNRNNPKRRAIADVFARNGYHVHELSVAHRMSESIVRDVLLCTLSQD